MSHNNDNNDKNYKRLEITTEKRKWQTPCRNSDMSRWQLRSQKQKNHSIEAHRDDPLWNKYLNEEESKSSKLREVHTEYQQESCRSTAEEPRKLFATKKKEICWGVPNDSYRHPSTQ